MNLKQTIAEELEKFIELNACPVHCNKGVFKSRSGKTCWKCEACEKQAKAFEQSLLKIAKITADELRVEKEQKELIDALMKIK